MACDRAADVEVVIRVEIDRQRVADAQLEVFAARCPIVAVDLDDRSARENRRIISLSHGGEGRQDVAAALALRRVEPAVWRGGTRDLLGLIPVRVVGHPVQPQAAPVLPVTVVGQQIPASAGRHQLIGLQPPLGRAASPGRRNRP